MKTHFDSHRIIRKIDTIEPDKFKTKQWDSFKMCHNKEDEAKNIDVVYGEMNPKLDAMELDL